MGPVNGGWTISQTVSLSCLPEGVRASVERVCADENSMRLREMGLREGRELEVICAGNPMICRVGECRMGICARLASRIAVATIE